MPPGAPSSLGPLEPIRVWAVTDEGVLAATGFSDGVLRCGDLELEVTHSPLGNGTRVDVLLRNPGSHSIRVHALHIGLAGPAAEQVLEHGWQSWSTVRRTTPTGTRPDRDRIAMRFVIDMHLADPAMAASRVRGDQFLLSTDGVVGFLDAKRNLGVIDAGDDINGPSAIVLLDGVVLHPERERRVDPLWLAAGDPGTLYSEYVEHWASVAGARVPAGPMPLGWCHWYDFFAWAHPQDLFDNLALAAQHKLDLFQIDDAYQRAIGDWLNVSYEFDEALGDEGMARYAREATAAGMQAGIWTAPFVAADTGRLLSENPDFAVTTEHGAPLRALFNPLWGSDPIALDTTHPGVIDFLHTTFSALREQGFTYHKTDFLFAGALAGVRHDPTRTRAEALHAGLVAVREGLGDDAFLLGCGCPLGPAVGLVDAMRVSCDTAPKWAPADDRPGLIETTPSTRTALEASVLRAPMHRRLWINDPDCLLLRETDTGLSERERELAAVGIIGSGGFVVLSDDLRRYGDHQWATVDRVRSLAREADTVLDIVDPFSDVVTVEGRSLRLEIDWRDEASSLLPNDGELVWDVDGAGPQARLTRRAGTSGTTS
jgi:alpha-galactosidase